jgi:hypothetical protein
MSITSGGTVYSLVTAQEISAEDGRNAVDPIRWEFPGSINPGGQYASGTTDNKWDCAWYDEATLTATTRNIDLSGALTRALGGATISAAECCGIFIANTATAAASVLTLGNGSNAAYSGLFGATGHTITIPASGMLQWFAPLDGGGLPITNSTADILKLDSGSATITYRIALLFRLT